MKKLAKKLLCLTAVLALTLSLFTGCKSKNEKTLFEYAGQEVTFQEAHVYARIMQYQAEGGAFAGDRDHMHKNSEWKARSRDKTGNGWNCK